MSDLNIGILGAGNIAQEHIKVVQAIEGLKVSSITSRTVKKAKDLASRFGIDNCHNSIEQFLRGDLDGIVVAVSAGEIFNVSKQLIYSRIPLLIEKPPGLNLDQAKVLKDLSKNIMH